MFDLNRILVTVGVDFLIPERADMQVTRSGVAYTIVCSRCAVTHIFHKWVHGPFKEEFRALKNGDLRCWRCGGHYAQETLIKIGKLYAGRYRVRDAIGWSRWVYNRSRFALIRELRDTPIV